MPMSPERGRKNSSQALRLSDLANLESPVPSHPVVHRCDASGRQGGGTGCGRGHPNSGPEYSDIEIEFWSTSKYSRYSFTSRRLSFFNCLRRPSARLEHSGKLVRNSELIAALNA